ncbi:LysM peptidoglycan-binding domain-containing protein [Comamonadaceae bacterium OH2545_COT-014]|nr:LysM peptidoglycan-binding domain-containing protein [Comamonadaceae bacterium OH2545_COT-014]
MTLFSSPLLRTMALAASVLLAGCATRPAGPAVASGADTDAVPGTTTPQLAGGPMSPVAVQEMNGRRVASLNTPADLWERIRRGYAMPNLDTDLVREREQWYAGRPDYIQRMTERSRMYIFHIVEELELRGMPTELALLPYIESAFNPQAVSSAKAAGMWQFMPATGSAFALRQNALRDDRRDVIASTRAALDYLQKLHDRFGDWHLALAAYNWGPGNVNRAIERNKAAGLGTGYLDLNMPAETRHYVPKLQAVKNIIARPEQFDAVLPDIGNHPFFDTVAITQDIDVALAAQLAEVRLEDFRALNPAMKRPVIFAAAAQHILLPWDNAATFTRNLKTYGANTPLASYTAWVAPETMSAAEAARRVGMSEEDLRSLNHIPPRMRVRAGSTLLVPRDKNHAAAVSPQVVNNAQLSLTPEIILRRTTVRARAGDTIARIASRYDLPAATVAGWNKASARGTLKRNQAVVLYLPVRTAKSPARSNGHRANGQRTNGQHANVHRANGSRADNVQRRVSQGRPASASAHRAKGKAAASRPVAHQKTPAKNTRASAGKPRATATPARATAARSRAGAGARKPAAKASKR